MMNSGPTMDTELFGRPLHVRSEVFGQLSCGHQMIGPFNEAVPILFSRFDRAERSGTTRQARMKPERWTANVAG